MKNCKNCKYYVDDVDYCLILGHLGNTNGCGRWEEIEITGLEIDRMGD